MSCKPSGACPGIVAHLQGSPGERMGRAWTSSYFRLLRPTFTNDHIVLMCLSVAPVILCVTRLHHVRS